MKTQNYGLKMNLPNTRTIFKYLRKNLSQFKMGQILKFSLKYIDRYVIKSSSYFICKTGPRCTPQNKLNLYEDFHDLIYPVPKINVK